jgi:hypothetical protein
MTQLRRNLRKRPLLVVVIYFVAPLGVGTSFSASFTFETYNEIGLQRRPGENSERECSLSVPHFPPPQSTHAAIQSYLFLLRLIHRLTAQLEHSYLEASISDLPPA